MALAVLAGGWLTACGEAAPIQRLVIPTRTADATPVPSTVAVTTPPAALATVTPKLPPPPPSRPPVPLQCSPPSDEDPKAPRGSALHFSGVCSFTETSKVSCSTQPDDFIFTFSRTTPNGPKLYFSLNVEFYKGPGNYGQSVQILIEIPDNGTFYEWNTQDGRATVDSGERSGSIHNVTLPPDPGTPTQGEITVDGTFACE